MQSNCVKKEVVADRVCLLVTASIELGGQFLFGQGLASSIRPRKYYTIPKETTEAILEDLAQLLDFALLEFQRVLFVENVVHSAAVWIPDARFTIESGLTNNSRPFLLP